jgi:hypothetical protein
MATVKITPIPSKPPKKTPTIGDVKAGEFFTRNGRGRAALMLDNDRYVYLDDPAKSLSKNDWSGLDIEDIIPPGSAELELKFPA